MLEGHLVVARHALEPGRGVGGAVGPAEAHRLGAARHLRLDVGLRDADLVFRHRLREEGAGDEDLENIQTVPVEARLADTVDAHRCAVDQRRHPRQRRRPGGIVHDVVDLRPLLEAAENRGGGLPALPLVELLGEPRADIVERHVGRGEMPLAFDDDELVGHLDHR